MRAFELGGRMARDPSKALGDIGRLVGSALRVLGPPPVSPSPLLRRRSLGRRLEMLEFPLDPFRRAAKAAGGSVNDAYISAICGALRRYHEELGVPVEAVPLAMPVNLRSDDDPAGGNRFAGARIAAPVGERDPARRIQAIRKMVLTAVAEPAVNALSSVSPVLSRLPTPLLGVVASVASTTDVQASNVPGYAEAPYIAGARIDKTFPFGPLPGVPMMIILVSQAGRCYVGVHYDTASVTDQDLFLRCLHEGFEEVLALDPQAGIRTVSADAAPLEVEEAGGGATTSPVLRLPGSVAEMQASPKGPASARFFDLDGTLIAGYSARYLARDRLRNREIGISELVRTLGVAVSAGLGRAGFEDLLELGAQAWRGRPSDDLDEMGERLFRQSIEDLIYPEMRDLVRAHQQRGHTVALSSSATSYQAEPVARFLGIDHVLCNRFVLNDGVLTGQVERPVLWGPGKALAVQRLAAELDVDLAKSYFYADGDEDLALMHLVGHPRPTNPGKHSSSKAAASRGWPVLRFTSRRSGGTGARLRTAAGLAALAPVSTIARRRRPRHPQQARRPQLRRAQDGSTSCSPSTRSSST